MFSFYVNLLTFLLLFFLYIWLIIFLRSVLIVHGKVLPEVSSRKMPQGTVIKHIPAF